jgi:hypothetical protein
VRVIVDGIERAEVTTLQSLNETWKEITSECYAGKRFIHYAIIDGQQFYDQYESALLNRYQDIQEVQIETISFSKSYEDSLNEMFQYITRLTRAIDSISSSFYGEPTEREFKYFTDFNEGLGWLYHTSLFIESIAERDESIIPSLQLAKITGIKNTIRGMLNEMERLIENQDFVSIADYLNYECADHLQMCQQDVEGIVRNEELPRQ